MPQLIPLELLATTPPIVQADSLAGSGPSMRPKGRSAALTARTVVPGSDADARAVVQDLDAAETLTHVQLARRRFRPVRTGSCHRIGRSAAAPRAVHAAMTRDTAASSRATTTCLGREQVVRGVSSRGSEIELPVADRGRVNALGQSGAMQRSRTAPEGGLGEHQLVGHRDGVLPGQDTAAVHGGMAVDQMGAEISGHPAFDAAHVRRRGTSPPLLVPLR